MTFSRRWTLTDGGTKGYPRLGAGLQVELGGKVVLHIKTVLVALGAATLAMFVFATAATADTITGQGTLTGTRYRGGVSSNGGVSFAAGVQVNRDPAGEITHVRAAARITKLSKVTAVQVDRVALGTSAGAVVTNGAPKNSGAASQISSPRRMRARRANRSRHGRERSISNCIARR